MDENHKASSPDKTAKPTGRLLYSRSEDGDPEGPLIINTLSDGTYLVGRGRRRLTYLTTRQLIIGLTGHPEGRHWTFDRYFRLGKYSRDTPYQPPIEDSPILSLFGGPSITTFSSGPLMTSGLVSPNLLTVASSGVQNGLGIDLKNRSGEVAKLLFAGFGRRIYAWGYDPEDVLQEVYYGILIRNQGSCPWDARKSSFGHYVHMVAGCILSNYHRRESRRRQVEQIGLAVPTNDGFNQNIDAADACASRIECATYLDTTPMVDKDFVKFLASKTSEHIVFQVLPLAIEGHRRQEIAQALNVPLGNVARALKTIKTVLSEWSLSPFLS